MTLENYYIKFEELIYKSQFPFYVEVSYKSNTFKYHITYVKRVDIHTLILLKFLTTKELGTG